MAIYLDGIQAIEDNVKEFKLISNGTISVGTNQTVGTTDINSPSKVYRNYAFIISNKSGQTVSSVLLQGKTTILNSPVPNTAIGTLFNIKTVTPTNTIATTGSGTLDLTSEEPNPFLVGALRVQITLAAAPTSGTIDWALIGY